MDKMTSVTGYRLKGANIKKLILQKLMGVPKDLGVDRRTLPDLVCHFGTPLRQFWIVEALLEGMIKSKKLCNKS